MDRRNRGVKETRKRVREKPPVAPARRCGAGQFSRSRSERWSRFFLCLFYGWLGSRRRGAARHAAHFKIGESSSLRAVVECYPRDQAADHGDGRRIRGDDEAHVVCWIHRQLTALACTSRSVRTRRRKISLRIAARCKVKNKSVNAAAMMNSGTRMLESMVEPPTRNTDEPWCSVFHQSTENLMTGRR